MTELSGCQVRELLPGPIERMEGTVKDELCQDPGISKTRLAWGFIGSEATESMRSVLDYDVFELVAHGWCVAKELHEYTDRNKHPLGERSIVHLAEHEFVKVVHPVLDIMIGSYKSRTLRFDLELTAHFRAAALSICDGYITGVGAGDGNVIAKLKYHDVTLHSHQTREVPYPAHIDFKAPGLAIG
ncbi:MAG: hypothetical protein WAM90_03165 [Rhodanobacter sp.]